MQLLPRQWFTNPIEPVKEAAFMKKSIPARQGVTLIVHLQNVVLAITVRAWLH